MSNFFLAIIVIGLGALIGLFLFAAFTHRPPHSAAKGKRESKMKRPTRIEVVRRAYEFWEKAGKPTAEIRNSSSG
jgi:hypothetical protein